MTAMSNLMEVGTQVLGEDRQVQEVLWDGEKTFRRNTNPDVECQRILQKNWWSQKDEYKCKKFLRKELGQRLA